MSSIPRKPRQVKPDGWEISVAYDVKVSFHNAYVAHWKRGDRQPITAFTPGSRMRFLINAYNAVADWRSGLHLTYPGNMELVPKDGKTVKKHLHKLLFYVNREIDRGTWLSDWAKENYHPEPLRYLWMLEFQERQAPHFHMLTDHYIPKEWLAPTWNRIAGSMDPDHLAAGTKVEAFHERFRAINYFAKVSHTLMVNDMAKDYSQKEVPEGFRTVGRFWGSSRDLVEWERHHLSRSEGDKLVQDLKEYCSLAGYDLSALGCPLEGFTYRRKGFTLFNAGEDTRKLLGLEGGEEDASPDGDSVCPAL